MLEEQAADEHFEPPWPAQALVLVTSGGPFDPSIGRYRETSLVLPPSRPDLVARPRPGRG